MYACVCLFCALSVCVCVCVYVCNVCVRNFVDQNLIRIELDFLCEEFDKFLNLGPSKDPIRLLGYISQF